MNHIIQTPSAKRLKEEIVKRGSEKIDANGNYRIIKNCCEAAYINNRYVWGQALIRDSHNKGYST